MFKYKSPLSRLLEGAGKAKENQAEDSAAPESEKPEAPIADFNALREALAGGNMASDSHEETDELIPEEKMPEFDASEDATAESSDETTLADSVPEGEEPAAQPTEVEAERADDDQVVTLRLTPQEFSPAEDHAQATPVEPIREEVAEAPAEPEAHPEPEAPQAVVEPASQAPADAAPQKPEPAPAPADDRRSRVKTTFLGFERADTHVQELIETAEPVGKSEAAQETFPVGWLVVTSGPGRGASVTLTEGLMQIGRNDDQAIQLDFGDTGISRSNHAVVAYDPEDRKCYLGHGGKANLVRLNGKPVLSTVPLSSGDLIRISETSLRFAAFCDDGFDWRDS